LLSNIAEYDPSTIAALDVPEIEATTSVESSFVNTRDLSLILLNVDKSIIQLPPLGTTADTGYVDLFLKKAYIIVSSSDIFSTVP
jgi:hypothetical protein